MKKNDLSIGILGLWHLGLVYSVSLAKSGYKVDNDPEGAILCPEQKGQPAFRDDRWAGDICHS